MQTILALDTSTEACSVALQSAQGLYVRHELQPRTHTQRLLPMVDEVLEEAGVQRETITAVIYGQGPGSFTGVRIASAAAQGLAFGLGVGVIGVSSLHALAQAAADAHNANQVLAAIDARMGEVYWGQYQRDSAEGILTLLGSEQVIPPETVSSKFESAIAAGTGWGQYAEQLSAAIDYPTIAQFSECYPVATALIKLAQSETPRSAESAIPVYLRNQVAKKAAVKPKA